MEPLSILTSSSSLPYQIFKSSLGLTFLLLTLEKKDLYSSSGGWESLRVCLRPETPYLKIPSVRTGVVALRPKHLTTRVLVWVLADLPLILGRKQKHGPNIWLPTPHVGDQDGIPIFCLWPMPVLAIVVILGVNKQIEDFFLSLSALQIKILYIFFL